MVRKEVYNLKSRQRSDRTLLWRIWRCRLTIKTCHWTTLPSLTVAEIIQDCRVDVYERDATACKMRVRMLFNAFVFVDTETSTLLVFFPFLSFFVFPLTFPSE
jgi:hypothetical protein